MLKDRGKNGCQTPGGDVALRLVKEKDAPGVEGFNRNRRSS
jgi:hypothetical protein